MTKGTCPPRFLLLAAALVFADSACVRETQETVVVVHPQGVEPAAVLLRVFTTIGRSLQQPNDFSYGFGELDLRLPSGPLRHVRLDVRAMDSSGNALARGISELDVPGIGRYDIDLPMAAVLVTITGGALTGAKNRWEEYKGKASGCGLYRMFVIEGFDPQGQILDSPTEDLFLPLTAGTHQFTYLGTSTDMPPWTGQIGANDRNGVPWPGLFDFNADAPGTSITAGNVTLTAVRLSVMAPSISAPTLDRVGPCDVIPDQLYDTIGQLTLTVSGAP